jgi:hypothetical protein
MSEKSDVHVQRLDKSVGPDSAFSCAVCYLDSTTSGLVTPTSCVHPICLSCYTKIVSLHKEKAKCPECRKFYMSSVQEIEEDPYSDLPPLINISYYYESYANYVNYDIRNYNINNNIQNYNINNIQNYNINNIQNYNINNINNDNINNDNINNNINNNVLAEIFNNNPDDQTLQLILSLIQPNFEG